MQYQCPTPRPTRIRFVLSTALVLAFMVMAWPHAGWSWNTAGHRLVARIAVSRLSPTALTRISELLDHDTIVTVAGWADVVKPARPETAGWHYAVFPALDANGRCSSDIPLGDNVITASIHCRDALRDPSRPLAERTEALKFFVHLIGDLHQPMHCSPEGNHGGNDIHVTFEGRPSNLHRVWDTDLTAATGLSESQYVEALLASAATIGDDIINTGTYGDWARESNSAAFHQALAIPANHQLDERYYEANIRTVNRRLLVGGLRLAAQLNAIFDNAAPLSMPGAAIVAALPIQSLAVGVTAN